MPRPHVALLLTIASVAVALRAPSQPGAPITVGEGAAITVGGATGSSSATKGFLYPGYSADSSELSRIQRIRFLLHKARDYIYNLGYGKLPTWPKWFLHVTVSWCIFMLLCLLVWMNVYPDDPDLEGFFSDREKADPVKTFTEDHFGCFNTPRICFCACVCPALRWADNVSLAGFMRVPVALGLFFTCALANGLTGTFCYAGFVTCCLILYYRHRLRAKLGLPSFTWGSCCADVFFVFCCSWCAIAQEARVVRYAYQQGTLSLATGKRYSKSQLPERPFPRAISGDIKSAHVLPPPPQPAPLAAQRLLAEGRTGG